MNGNDAFKVDGRNSSQEMENIIHFFDIVHILGFHISSI